MQNSFSLLEKQSLVDDVKSERQEKKLICKENGHLKLHIKHLEKDINRKDDVIRQLITLVSQGQSEQVQNHHPQVIDSIGIAKVPETPSSSNTIVSQYRSQLRKLQADILARDELIYNMKATEKFTRLSSLEEQLAAE